MPFNFFDDVASDLPDAVLRITADTTISAGDFIRGRIYVTADLSAGNVTTTFADDIPDGSIIYVGVHVEQGANRHVFIFGDGTVKQFAPESGIPVADGAGHIDIKGYATFKLEGNIAAQYREVPFGASGSEGPVVMQDVQTDDFPATAGADGVVHYFPVDVSANLATSVLEVAEPDGPFSNGDSFLVSDSLYGCTETRRIRINLTEPMHGQTAPNSAVIKDAGVKFKFVYENPVIGWAVHQVQ